MKTNTLLFIALFTLLSGSVKAQIRFFVPHKPIGQTIEEVKAKYENIMQNAPIIIRGDFVSGNNPADRTKWLPEEKPYIEKLMYIVPKKIKVKAVLRGDTALIGKIITVPFKIGLALEGELINSSHAMVSQYINDQYDEYYFLENSNLNSFKNLCAGFKPEDNRDLYKFNLGFYADEASFFQAIIDSKNYNPKFMLEAGMKIPETEKKAVGFLVKEAEEPMALYKIFQNSKTNI